MRGVILRRFAMLALAVGAVVGFGSALHGGAHRRHDAFEAHVAELCANAALRSAGKAGTAEVAPAP